MVIHSTHKESLNGDGQPFHLYQQTEQSITSQLIGHKKDKEIQVLSWGQAQKYGRVKPVNGIPFFTGIPNFDWKVGVSLPL